MHTDPSSIAPGGWERARAGIWQAFRQGRVTDDEATAWLLVLCNEERLGAGASSPRVATHSTRHYLRRVWGSPPHPTDAA